MISENDWDFGFRSLAMWPLHLGDANWIVLAQSGTAESSINSRHPAAGGAGGLGRGWSAADGVHPRLVRPSLRSHSSQPATAHTLHRDQLLCDRPVVRRC